MKVYIPIVWNNKGTEEIEVFKSYHEAVEFGLEAQKKGKRWRGEVIIKEIK